MVSKGYLVESLSSISISSHSFKKWEGKIKFNTLIREKEFRNHTILIDVHQLHNSFFKPIILKIK